MSSSGLERVEMRDVRVGDRLWNPSNMAHPYVVVAVDADIDGPVIWIHRWDMEKYAVFKIDSAGWPAWHLSRVIMDQPCVHCGRKDQ